MLEIGFLGQVMEGIIQGIAVVTIWNVGTVVTVVSTAVVVVRKFTKLETRVAECIERIDKTIEQEKQERIGMEAVQREHAETARGQGERIARVEAVLETLRGR